MKTKGASTAKTTIELPSTSHGVSQKFLQSQFGEYLPRIGLLVTLTGSALYAQATTCSAYLRETRPNSGQSFLSALQAALDSKEGHDKEGKPAHTKGNAHTLHFLHGISFSATITRDIVLGDALHASFITLSGLMYRQSLTQTLTWISNLVVPAIVIRL